eukprot:873966-Amphidinium_carterae.1
MSQQQSCSGKGTCTMLKDSKLEFTELHSVHRLHLSIARTLGPPETPQKIEYKKIGETNGQQKWGKWTI